MRPLEVLGIISLIIVLSINQSTPATPPPTHQPLKPNDYEDSEEDIPPKSLVWYKKIKKTYYRDPENGDYYKNQYGQFIKFKNTYSRDKDGTFYKDPKGMYKKVGGRYVIAPELVTVKVIRKASVTTTRPPLKTLAPPKPQVFQNLYMKGIVDSLPLIETVVKCTYCPRIYMPVCGSDHRSYTNICRLNCMNLRKKNNVTLQYNGICQYYIDPYDY